MEVAYDPREAKGKAIAKMPDQIQRVDQLNYLVKSQSGNGFYTVHLDTAVGWQCSCPDHVYREVKCKHIWAVLLSVRLRETVLKSTVIQPLDTSVCPYCMSSRIVRHGLRHNRYGDLQRFTCKDCGTRFSHNIGFEGMKASPKAITSAMQLYFTGESLRNVQKFLRLQGVRVSHVAVYKWIRKYTALMERYVSKITPQVGDTWRADELFLKVSGNMKYLYALMDDETRFWIAQEVAGTKYTADVRPLFAKGKEVAGKRPRFLITDGAYNFHEAYMKELRTIRCTTPKHIQEAKIDGIPHNNKMERLNGEIRDRERVVRGVKKEDGPLVKGLQIYHNYVREHQGLDRRTPAEVAGIKVEGQDKWLTLIQNASQNRQSPSPRQRVGIDHQREDF
jgi:transposase-like protein